MAPEAEEELSRRAYETCAWEITSQVGDASISLYEAEKEENEAQE